MPTVMRIGGFAFGIYTRDHGPAHVHVHYAGRQCKIELETLKLTASSMNAKEESQAVRLVSAHGEALLALWLAIHPEGVR